MTDPLERPGDYASEVRPAPRYGVGPGGLEALWREGAETPYRSLSLLAVAALAVSVGYCFFVALGGVVAFWDSAPQALIIGTILVPLLSLPVAIKFDIRDRLGQLRFAGWALALFYAIPVGVGGLVAFPSHPPWLLPLWTLVFPLLAAGCGAAARFRIRASEDTLSGEALATWAVGLSLFFGLCYAAIYTATYLAVSQQAIAFADGWIEKLQKDNLERAFVQTIAPPQRLADGTLPRDQIELTHNSQAGLDGLPPYSSFCQATYVRLLRGSAKPDVTLVAVRDWGYQQGGYKVQLSYRVTTPNWSFPLELSLDGSETPDSKIKGRRWFVQLSGTGMPRGVPIQFTADGKRLQALNASGHDFAVALIPKLSGPVPVDDKQFWAPDLLRPQVTEKMNKLFAPDGDKGLSFHLRDVRDAPSWSAADDRLRFRYDGEALMDVKVQVPSLDGPMKTETNKVRVDFRLLISCPAAALQGSAPEWRLDGLELIRGRTVELKPQGKRR